MGWGGVPSTPKQGSWGCRSPPQGQGGDQGAGPRCRREQLSSITPSVRDTWVLGPHWSPARDTHLAPRLGHPGQPQLVGQHGRCHRRAVVAPPTHQHHPQARDLPPRPEGEAGRAWSHLRDRGRGTWGRAEPPPSPPPLPPQHQPPAHTLVTPFSLQTCTVLYVYLASMKSLLYVTSGLSTRNVSAIVPGAGIGGNGCQPRRPGTPGSPVLPRTPHPAGTRLRHCSLPGCAAGGDPWLSAPRPPTVPVAVGLPPWPLPTRVPAPAATPGTGGEQGG